MKKKKKKSFLTLALCGLIVLSLAAIVYVSLYSGENRSTPDRRTLETKPVTPDRPAPGKPDKKSVSANQAVKKESSREKTPRPSDEAVTSGGKDQTVVAKIIPPRITIRQVAIIIDDIGHDMKALRDLMQIDPGITFAVLPGLAHSREAAELLHRSAREILLHLPMEPRSYPKEKPGQGALFTDMNREEIIYQLENNLASVPHARGVNNHMGSKFMSDEDKLVVVFEQLKKRNLFFIDSRTTPDSKAYAVSRQVGLALASRKVFLDNDRDVSRIYRILLDAVEAPQTETPLILIGHPYPETIRALQNAKEKLRENGVSIIPVSRMVSAHRREAS